MPSLPSLKQLRYLIALAEHLNFTRAAEACFVSQSTLGVQLVERDMQTVSITQIGAEVVARAGQVMTSAEDLSNFVGDAALPTPKQLRLSVIPTIAPFVLRNLMPMLRLKFPKLQLALREDLTANLLARLRSRQLARHEAALQPVKSP